MNPSQGQQVSFVSNQYINQMPLQFLSIAFEFILQLTFSK